MGDRLPLYSNKVSDRRLVRWHKAIHIQTDLDRLNFFLGWGGGVGGGDMGWWGYLCHVLFVV